MFILSKKTLLATGVAAALFGAGSVLAAEVPAGVQLASQQVLVHNNGTEVASLDPQKVEGTPEFNIVRNLFETLLINDPDGHPIAGLAEKWSHDNFKVWTFQLRQDIQWSDGSPITAEDFVYSWQRLADPKTASPYSSHLQDSYVANINDILAGKKSPSTLGIKALDARTIEVTLSQSVPYFYKMMTLPAVAAVPRAAIEKFGDKWTQPENMVTSGAYKLKQWIVNERIVLERNDKYWNNAKTVINQVTYLPIASEVSAINRYRSGEIDITQSIPPDLFANIKKEIPNEVHISPVLCTYYYEINNQKPPFDDVRVRTALKLALDRDIIVNKILKQGQTPAYGYTPPYTDGAKMTAPPWAGWSQQKRDEEAKKLLAEAGYSAAKPLSFTLLYNTSDQHKKLAIAAASIWKKSLGINVKLENQEWKTFLDNRHQANFDIARAGWCADYNEPSSFLSTMLSNSSHNTAQYKSAAFDQLISIKAIQADDEALRTSLYDQAEQQLDQDSAIVPLYHYVNVYLVKPWVGGFSDKNPLNTIYAKDLYIVQH